MNHGDSPGDVVVGVDGSPDADRAVRWAAGEAERRGCPLRLVHATGTRGEPHPEPADDRDPRVQAGHTLLAEVHDRLGKDHPDLKVSGTVARGDPAEVILSAADGAVLTVLGTRGRGGFAALLLGSVSLRVAAHTMRPLVVVRGSRPPDVIENVLVGAQDETDAEAIRFALRTAERARASVRAAHVWDPLNEVGLMTTRIDTVRELHARHERRLARAVEKACQTHSDVAVAREVVTGRVAAELVEASGAADLLVVGAHRPAGPLSLRLGLVGHAVLHHALCPVAVVPEF